VDQEVGDSNSPSGTSLLSRYNNQLTLPLGYLPPNALTQGLTHYGLMSPSRSRCTFPFGSLGGSHRARGSTPLLKGLGTVVGLGTTALSVPRRCTRSVAVLRCSASECLRGQVPVSGVRFWGD
jgi:hypothetical protein